jgi:hypothetical protein
LSASTHDVPHTSGVSAGHVQVPSRQSWLGEHARVHSPQWSGSNARSTHPTPGQKSGVAGLAQVHVPALQS